AAVDGRRWDSFHPLRGERGRVRPAVLVGDLLDDLLPDDPDVAGRLDPEPDTARIACDDDNAYAAIDEDRVPGAPAQDQHSIRPCSGATVAFRPRWRRHARPPSRRTGTG